MNVHAFSGYNVVVVPPVTEVLYGGLAGTQTTSDLYLVDPVTAVFSSIGASGYAITGLAMRPSDNVLYGASSGNSASSPRSLLHFDTGTGAGTVDGAFGKNIPDIAFSSVSDLYGFDSTTKKLHTIDQSTGAATVVPGATAVGGTTVGFGLSFDSADNLYVFPHTANGGVFYLVDPATGGLTSQPALSGSGVTGVAPIAAAAFDASDVCYILYFGGTGTSVWWLGTVNIGTGVITPIASTEDWGDAIGWSLGVTPPTGNMVVYNRYSAAVDAQEIWGVPAAGGAPQQITSRATQEYDDNPDMNSAGTQVVFTHEAAATASKLWIINSDGTGETVIDNTNLCRSPQFKPDGTSIVYNIANGNLFVINPDGTGKTTVTPSVGTSPTTPGGYFRPTWNRDGTKIGLQVSRSSGNPEELWVMNPDGSSPVKVATLVNTILNGFGFSWAHTTDTIAYVKGTAQKDVRSVLADGTGDVSISDGGIATDPGGGQTVVEVGLTRYAWSADDSTVFALQKLTGPDRWAAWSLQADGSADVALPAPLDDLQQTVGSGFPYVYNDRVYAVDVLGNMWSTALDGSDSRSEDGDSNVDLFISIQSAGQTAL